MVSNSFLAARQVRHPRNLKEVAGYFLMSLLVAGVLNVSIINLIAFPDCNRITRNCFLVHHLWGAQ